MTYLATLNYWLHDTDNKERSRIADNCYVSSSNSTATKQTILQYLFKNCNISSNVLEFELYPQADKLIEDDVED